MNKEDRIGFIHELLKKFTHQFYEMNDRIPDNWDGLELRALLSNMVRDEDRFIKRDVKRFKEFKNDCLIKNL